jgi:hypothetical protein
MVVMVVPICGCCSSSSSRKSHWQGDGYELLVRVALLLLVVVVR